MPLTQVLLSGQSWQRMDLGLHQIDGPAFDENGDPLVWDARTKDVRKLHRSGELGKWTPVESWPLAGRPRSLQLGSDGRLWAAQPAERRVVTLDADGKLAVVAGDLDCEYLTVDQGGAVFAADAVGQKVWYVGPEVEGRRPIPRVVAEGFRPTALTLWADGRTLVVGDADHPWLRTFQVGADGQLRHGGNYYGPLRTPAGTNQPGTSGLAIDRQGRLYAATTLGVQVFDPTGRPSGLILPPRREAVTSIVFAGENRRWLTITCGNNIYQRLTKVQGLPPRRGE